MNIDPRCPMCDQDGVEVHGQDSDTLVCLNKSCRVTTFTRYYG